MLSILLLLLFSIYSFEKPESSKMQRMDISFVYVRVLHVCKSNNWTKYYTFDPLLFIYLGTVYPFYFKKKNDEKRKFIKKKMFKLLIIRSVHLWVV